MSAAPPRSSGLALKLAWMSAFGPMAIDLYLPALPQIAVDLQASPTEAQASVSIFLIGFGLAQLLFGPLSDQFGRRRPAMAGAALFVLGSALCALAPSMTVLWLGRALQALGACAGPVTARAIPRDLYGRDGAARMMSWVLAAMGLAPLIAPSIGAALLKAYDWRMNFWMLAGFGCVAVFVAATLPESLPPALRRRANLRQALAAYSDLLGTRGFTINALTVACYFSGLFAFIAASPFVYAVAYNVPPEQYALLFGLNAAGMVCVTLLNGRVAPRWGADKTLRRALRVSAVAALALLAIAWSGWGGLPALAAGVAAVICTVGMVGANGSACALSAAPPERAGAGAAALGGLQFALGAVSAGVTGLFAPTTAAPLATIIAAAVWIALALNAAARSRPRANS